MRNSTPEELFPREETITFLKQLARQLQRATPQTTQWASN